MRALHRFTLVLLLAAVAMVSLAAAVSANPPGIPAGEKLEYKFNLIGRPDVYAGGCGEGNRLFVLRDAHSAQVLVTNGASWNVTDCDATGDHRGELTTSNVGVFDIFVRILGKPGGNLRICADTYEDFMAGETLCLLGTIDLTRGSGQSKFQVAPSAMFDASLEDIMWTVDTNRDFRIAQFRVYRRP